MLFVSCTEFDSAGGDQDGANDSQRAAAGDGAEDSAAPSPIKAGPPPAEGAAIGTFGIGEGTEIRDLAAHADGTVVACGVLGDGAEPPAGDEVRSLFGGPHEAGVRPFVMKLSRGLDRLEWFALLPAGSIDPNRVLALSDGGVAIGGRDLGGMKDVDTVGANWSKGKAALLVVEADGTQVRWLSPGGPNQDGITGLAESRGRLYYTGGCGVRSASNYILRRDVRTGESVEWDETGWCVYLHTNQEALKADGQFLAFYEKARGSKDGFDYDGEGGWGPVGFSLQGFRIGGQVVALPDGDIVVTSGLQYDFREKGKKKFPAFDLFVARYGPEGTLRWSTNLYAEGDSVHTPDQKPIDLAYDPKSDRLFVLAKQHGSNVYRFKGNLVGDTGNLMIGWLGRVNPADGGLEAGWYFQNNRAGEYAADGVPKSPPYPKLAGNNLTRVAVGPDGLVHVAGAGAPKMWTTKDAWQPWPADQSGGGQAALVTLEPDLKTVRFASCFFTDGEPTGLINGLVALPTTVIAAGRATPDAATLDRCRAVEWAKPIEGKPAAVLWSLR